MMIANMPSVLPMVKAGKLRALAVTSLKRSPTMPELPTVSESGVPGFEVDVWYGVLAPAKTPKPVIARINQDMRKILEMPDVKQRLADQGAEAASSTPEEFGARIRADIVKWAKVVKNAGIQPE